MNETDSIKTESKNVGKQSENALRQNISGLITAIPQDIFAPLLDLYRPFQLTPTVEDLQQIMVRGLQNPKRSSVWKTSSKEGIHMGYYPDAPSFYTSFFHELGHFTLNHLEVDNDGSVSHSG